jgi:hypothetical protein
MRKCFTVPSELHFPGTSGYDFQHPQKELLMKKAFAGLLLFTLSAVCQDSASLKTIHKVYIEKMPNDLDQYLRAEIAKQFKGKLIVVLKKEDAEGIITGVNEEQKGTAAKVTGRYLGLHDTVNGTISLLDKTESAILWSDEAGDRNLFFGIAHRGGERKLADRLVGKLKKAMDTSR